jgi:hypothetical protein
MNESGNKIPLLLMFKQTQEELGKNVEDMQFDESASQMIHRGALK